MIHLLLVAGTSHHKPATALRKALIARGYGVTVVTAKTSLDTLRQQVELKPTVIWLANSQTTINQKIYVQFYAALKKQGAHIIPVAVGKYDDTHIPTAEINMTHDINAVAEKIDVIISPPPAPKTSRNLLGGVIGLVVVLLLIAGVFGMATRAQPEETLPTLIALNIANSEIDITEAVVTVTDVLTATATIETQAETIAEATQEILEFTAEVTAELTEEVDALAFTAPITPTAIQQTLFVDFAVDLPRGYAPLDVRATNLSSGSIQAYQWDFETDGIIDSTDVNPPPITYATAGVYTLTLTVIDDQNRTLQSQKIIEVFDVVPRPVSENEGRAFAKFITSTSSGQVPLDVQFINRTVGSNLTYQWDLNGDGRIDYEGVSPPTFTYSQAGTYTARLDVITESGARDSAQTQINVYNSAPDDVVEQIYDSDSKADFAVSPTSGVIPLRVNITNLSLGTNNSYEWDFDGDGVVDSASANPRSQRFATVGTHTITLTVKGFDRFGGAKISRAQINVIASPKIVPTSTRTPIPGEPLDLEADFSVNVFRGNAPLTVQYYNYSSGDNATYQWDFDGNGTIDSTNDEPNFTFVNGGNFESILYVSDSTGSDSTSVIIEVIMAQTSPTPTPTPTLTRTPIAVGTSNATYTITPSFTPTPLNYVVIPTTTTPKATFTPTLDSVTQIATATATFTPTQTQTVTPSPTLTFTLTPTVTPSLTKTATFTPTFTPTYTPTVTPSITPTATPTVTPESTE